MADPPGEVTNPASNVELRRDTQTDLADGKKPPPHNTTTNNRPQQRQTNTSDDNSALPTFKDQVFERPNAVASVPPARRTSRAAMNTSSSSSISADDDVATARLPTAAAQRAPHDLSFKDQVYDYNERRRQNASSGAYSASSSFEVQQQRQTNHGNFSPSSDNVATAELISPNDLKASANTDNNAFFPMPQVFHVKVRKPLGPIGVAFRRESKEAGIIVSQILPGSPYQGTEVQVGQQLLAINGCAATSPKHVLSLLRDIPASASLTLSTCTDTTTPDCCNLVLEPCFKHNPGVSFCDVRNGTLVRIDQIFKGGPFSADSTLSEMDIVLAVNGVAVSSAQEARNALKLSLRRDFMELYVIGHRKFLNKIIREAQKRFEAPTEFPYQLKVQTGLPSSVALTVGRDVESSLDGLWLNMDTYLLEFAGETRPPVIDNTKIKYQQSLGRKQNCKNFVKLYNQLMTRQLNKIVQDVCCEAWKHAAQDREESTLTDLAPETSVAFAEVLEVPLSANEYFG